MASSKSGSFLANKRSYEDDTVSSPINEVLTQDGRKRQKIDVSSSLGVAVDSTIMSAPDQFKTSPGLVTGSSDLSTQTRARQGENQEQAALRLEKMQGAVRTLLECIGEDPGRDGLLDTPSRYAKALLFLTKGYHTSLEDIIHIGYIPSDTVIGLSKLPRIAEVFARRLQIQERLTKQVAHVIMDILRPQGVAVVMESSHLCMVMRGVEKTTATTLTSCMLGCFERENKARDEFMHFVGANR